MRAIKITNGAAIEEGKSVSDYTLTLYPKTDAEVEVIESLLSQFNSLLVIENLEATLYVERTLKV